MARRNKTAPRRCHSDHGPLTVPLRDVVLLAIRRELPRLARRQPQIIHARQHLLELAIQVLRRLVELLERVKQVTVQQAIEDRKLYYRQLRREGVLIETATWYPSIVWHGVRRAVAPAIQLMHTCRPSLEPRDGLAKLADELEVLV